MRFDMLANLGAYLAPTGPFINTIGIVNCLSGVYDVPAAYARIRLALTNTAPMAAYRGAGRPVMSYALERLVEHAARELGMDPAELRRRNFIRSSSRTRSPPASSTTAGDFEGVMDKALAAADWKGFASAKSRIGQARASCAGAACRPTSKPPAPGFAPQDQIEMRWGDDGDAHALRADAQPRPGPRDDVSRSSSRGVLGIPMESDPPAHRRARVLSSPATPPAARARCSPSAA